MDIRTGFSKAECLGGLKRIQESELTPSNQPSSRQTSNNGHTSAIRPNQNTFFLVSGSSARSSSAPAISLASHHVVNSVETHQHQV